MAGKAARHRRPHSKNSSEKNEPCRKGGYQELDLKPQARRKGSDAVSASDNAIVNPYTSASSRKESAREKAAQIAEFFMKHDCHPRDFEKQRRKQQQTEGQHETEENIRDIRKADHKPTTLGSIQSKHSKSSENEITSEISNEKKYATCQGDEFWRRLPSRILSFGSAEYLTVPEIFQHASLYLNRSVHFIGLVKSRSTECCQSDSLGVNNMNARVELRLEDPLYELNRAKYEESIAKIREDTKSSKKRKEAPVSKESPLALDEVSRPKKKRSKSKLPWFELKAPPPSSIGTRLSSSTSISSNDRSGYLSGSQNPSHDNQRKGKCLKGLSVSVDLLSVSNVETLDQGSLALIVGTVRSRPLQTRDFSCVIEARVVQNVSSTNVGRFTQQILERRKYLYKKHKQYRNNGGVLSGDTIIQGCGPPPYENLDSV